MNSIKFIDIQEKNTERKESIALAINQVIDEGDFIQGNSVLAFETNLAKYLRVKHVIGVGNGTDALQIALLALELKSGDEVIVPSFTYFATIEAILFLGLIPVLADINPSTFTLDPDSVEMCISKKTRVILPVHIFGMPSDMNMILQIAQKYNLKVIEDAAQAIGAEIMVNGISQKVSTLGDIGCFSFYPAKNLGAFGDAGAVVTNDDKLAIRIRMIANHGQSKKYVHELIGMNSRLDSIQAAVLNEKLKYLHIENKKREDIAILYNKYLSNLYNVNVPKIGKSYTHVFHQYTIRVSQEKRDSLRSFLGQRGIPTRLYYPIPIYKQNAVKGKCKVPFELKNSEEVQESMISLPMHVYLESTQIKLITQNIGLFYS